LGIISLHTALLALISVIDFETRLILNRVIYPAIVIAALLSFVTPGLTVRAALSGGAVGFALTGLIYLGGMLFVKSASAARHRH
jgi:prepilin signal peptidase PulO-like enzyme (type II secretory pathway)